MYVIKRSDGVYVALPGRPSSYTNRLQYAQTFHTKEEAERNRCPGNEFVVSVDSELVQPAPTLPTGGHGNVIIGSYEDPSA